MNPWQKESLGLQVGYFIIGKDEAVELEGQPAVVTPGMKGNVLSLHDGFHLDVIQGDSIPPKANLDHKEPAVNFQFWLRKTVPGPGISMATRA